MKKTIIHLSDLHFQKNWEEDQDLVLEAFFKDLAKQIEPLISSNVYFVFSGDVVFAGGNPELYEGFLNQFDTRLNNLKIFKNQRICVPGNHDVSVKYIERNSVEHEGVVSQKLNERKFNDYLFKKPQMLIDKFANYIAFQSKFADYGISSDTISGTGWNLDDNIAIYCLNTAICSSGGFNGIKDEDRLAIDTRSLQKWISGCKASTKNSSNASPSSRADRMGTR